MAKPDKPDASVPPNADAGAPPPDASVPPNADAGAPPPEAPTGQAADDAKRAAKDARLAAEREARELREAKTRAAQLEGELRTANATVERLRTEAEQLRNENDRLKLAVAKGDALEPLDVQSDAVRLKESTTLTDLGNTRAHAHRGDVLVVASGRDGAKRAQAEAEAIQKRIGTKARVYAISPEEARGLESMIDLRPG